MHFKQKLILIFLWLLSIDTFAGQFTTGLGYLYPEKYRRDNEINPLPFGLSIVPMLAYRGERFSLLGPRANYIFYKSLLSVTGHLNVAGDRYKANILKERETGIHAGLSVRVPFLNFRYEHDISGTHKGYLFRATLGVPFWRLSDSLFLRAGLTREFVNGDFANYYYGVTAEEVGLFSEYSVGFSQNTLVNLGLTYKVSENTSYVFNINHKRFDSDIANSPTIRLKNYNMIALFWNYTFSN